MASSEQTGAMTNSLYVKLKWIALILLPALGALYCAVAGIWGLGHATQVLGTITALDTFLGVILQLSSNSYYKNGANFDGTLSVVEQTEEGPKVQLSFDQDKLSEAIDEPGKHSVELQLNKLKTTSL